MGDWYSLAPRPERKYAKTPLKWTVRRVQNHVPAGMAVALPTLTVISIPIRQFLASKCEGRS
uniref:Uncharacterized protein n=1 Tax=Pseudomonas fluorescens (strain SBW25) TaxID=216595 RepID=A0A0G4E5E2_PSEFS|nr:hypothetical protein PQBR57_0239 [Pseudomonas fluorescens SBW25]